MSEKLKAGDICFVIVGHDARQPDRRVLIVEESKAMFSDGANYYCRYTDQKSVTGLYRFRAGDLAKIWPDLPPAPTPRPPDAVPCTAAAPPKETDPTGRAQNTPGAKVDAGKNRLGLVLGAFSRSLQAVGQVGTFGAQKYTDNGWISVPDGERRYLDAMLRHTFDEAAGQARDPQTELLHAAHTAWNALARLDLILRRLEQTPTDK